MNDDVEYFKFRVAIALENFNRAVLRSDDFEKISNRYKALIKAKKLLILSKEIRLISSIFVENMEE